MNIELSDRDKRLLLKLTIFVIVVCVGYFGVLPNVLKGLNNIKQIEKERDKSGNEELISAQLPLVMDNNRELEELIAGENERLADYMGNAELGEYVGKCIAEADLTAYDMSINEAYKTAISPYKLSDKAYTGESVVLSQADALMSKRVGANGILIDNIAEPTSAGEEIVCTAVNARISGDESDMLKFIDKLEHTKGIRVMGFTLDGAEKRFMNISLMMYMRRG